MSSKWSFFIALCLLMAAKILPANDFSIGNNQINLQGFKAYGTLPQKQEELAPESSGATWTITGSNALSQGDHFQLSGFEMELNSPARGKIFLRSPHCDFNRGEYEIKSNAPLIMNMDGLQISGIGYDVYQKAGKLILVLRSTVQIHFQRDKMTFSRKTNSANK